ncbi:hypothetical protein TRFO_23441 [Tritrichomonas foetus]|uniref:Exostosin GT47 domain-containing protein n=1 Tax=Tritrichomonas foetus TaxID=1144522 RepID=A0A1J4KFN1_9EUKA|nr:hypothetical protein TRFO_23441 [Tritrichomonas foetus]|eukprot:OHT08157.1 hypothetical protein TRFO_23441 [Tritrichomonas foetus]
MLPTPKKINRVIILFTLILLFFSFGFFAPDFPLNHLTHINISLLQFRLPYSDAFHCLKLNSSNYQNPNTEFGRKHYSYLLNITSPYRWRKRTSSICPDGPFLENLFIERYLHKPLSYFGIFIPLFVTWHGEAEHSFPRKKRHFYRNIINKIRQNILPQYIYLVFCECDWGFTFIFGHCPKNVLVISASGEGHLPIPWIQCNYSYFERLQASNFMVFQGSENHTEERVSILKNVKNVLNDKFIQKPFDSNWMDFSRKALFGLSPRGVAISTYRTYELIQFGVIPFIVNDGPHWRSFSPRLNWDLFAFHSNLTELSEKTKAIGSLLHKEIRFMQMNLDYVRKEFFTYEGIFREFELFLHNKPSYISCPEDTFINFHHGPKSD